jgi:hypothetical protein
LLAFLQNKEVYKVVFAKDEKAFRTICPKKKKIKKKKKNLAQQDMTCSSG